MVDRPRARRTRVPEFRSRRCGKVGCRPPAKYETQPDGSLRLVDTLTAEQALAFALEVASAIEVGAMVMPAWVEVGRTDEVSKISREAASEPASFGRTVARFFAAAFPGARYFAFVLDCGCGMRVEVACG